jgi:hypothetical protein
MSIGKWFARLLRMPDEDTKCGICGSTSKCLKPDEWGECPVNINLGKIEENDRNDKHSDQVVQ